MRNHIILRDIKKRILTKKYEFYKNLLKSIYLNEKLEENLRINAFILIQKISRNASLCRVRNRCIKSARSRGVLSKFRLSRHMFKRLSSKGLINGIFQASW